MKPRLSEDTCRKTKRAGKLLLLSPQHIPHPLHHGKESIKANLPLNYTQISPGTYCTRSQNLKITPTKPRLNLFELFLLRLWQNIKENISRNLPLVCKWDQDGLGALDSIWGLMNHKISICSWKPAETQMCGVELGQLWMWFPLLSL